MGYTLEAVIGSPVVLRTVVTGRPGTALVSLRQGLAMVPMTDEFFDSVTDGTDDRRLGFWKLPGGFERLLAALSTEGPVGYVEADFLGGIGGQRAALWVDGALVVGPLSVDVGQPFPDDGSPISQVLRQLGAVRGSHRDEFEAVGLRRHRHTEEWVP